MISSAFAQSAAGGAGGFSLQGLLPFILIFIIFYFLLIRPQQKRVKQHKLMVESLKRGNKVLTAGGISRCCYKSYRWIRNCKCRNCFRGNCRTCKTNDI